MKKLILIGLFLMSMVAVSCEKPTTETVQEGDTILVEKDSVKVDTLVEDTLVVDTLLVKHDEI